MTKLHNSILRAVSTIISEEQKNLQQIIGNSERSKEEKLELMEELDGMGIELTANCDNLRQLLAEAEQVMV